MSCDWGTRMDVCCAVRGCGGTTGELWGHPTNGSTNADSTGRPVSKADTEAHHPEADADHQTR
ncbi:hypothetical protein GCM10027269_05750 [Kribbella endophytica]